MTALAFVPPAAAQEPPAPLTTESMPAPAHIAFVDGVAILERDGAPDDSPLNMPLLAGDRLRTRTGRVEVLFADGATLHLDHHTTLDLQSDELVRLLDGRIRLSIPGPAPDVSYRIDGPQGWVRISEPGDYRITTLNGPRGRELELEVLRGFAELANEAGETPLRAGERALVRAGEAPSYPYVANSASWDAFDRWSEARRDERLRANAEYLPDEVRPYAATLHQYGDWRVEPTYGRVWYPRVQPDWRPYYRGRWVSLRPYGWTWVAHDPWGWPTHHYGRWGFSGSAWFWIPGRSWGAAWVSWASAPGYISWCPLGWDNRPVIAININIGRRWDPWRAWTVIPRQHFGFGYVHRSVIRVDRLDHRVRTAFVHHDRLPSTIGRAVPRGGAPIRVAGTRLRGDGPVYSNRPVDRARVTSGGSRAPAVGARPSPQSIGRPSRSDAPRANVVGRAVPRERSVPSGPAVRSQRPAATGPERSAPSAAAPSSPAPERSRSAVGSRPSRPEPTAPGARPRAVERPSSGSPPPRAAGPSRPAPQMAPRTSPPPAASRPPDRRGRPDEGITRSAPPATSAPRAVPRREYGARPAPEPRGAATAPARRSPSGAVRSAPPVERRGPEPRTSGSNERRGAAPARAPRAGAPPRGGGRPAGSAPSGARPRPSGGG